MNKQFYFFDLDGTLSDPKEGITKSLQYALADYGIEVDNPDSLGKFIGPPLLETFIGYYGFSETEARAAVRKYRERYAVTGLYENIMYDGVPGLLGSLADRGKTLAVATSKPTVYAEETLRYFGIREYFAFVAGSEFDGTRSRKSDVISYAVENMDTSEPDACVMIGDREYDVTGAKENGIECVGVLYGYGGIAELESAGADYISKTVGELESLLLSLA